MTEKETLAAPAFAAYMGAKTLAEKAVWEFADEHKDLDITVCTYPPSIFLSTAHSLFFYVHQ